MQASRGSPFACRHGAKAAPLLALLGGLWAFAMPSATEAPPTELKARAFNATSGW